jgi:hypothetical protein
MRCIGRDAGGACSCVDDAIRISQSVPAQQRLAAQATMKVQLELAVFNSKWVAPINNVSVLTEHSPRVAASPIVLQRGRR